MMSYIGSRLPSRNKPWTKSKTTIVSTGKHSVCKSYDQNLPSYLTPSPNPPHSRHFPSISHTRMLTRHTHTTYSHDMLTRLRARLLLPAPHRYHESTSSFAALATQSSMLSQSASALFDKDHPSMAGKGTHGIAFKELKQDQLDAIRKKIGLRDWDDES